VRPGISVGHEESFTNEVGYTFLLQIGLTIAKGVLGRYNFFDKIRLCYKQSRFYTPPQDEAFSCKSKLLVVIRFGFHYNKNE
jgi:hypothetical protein